MSSKPFEIGLVGAGAISAGAYTAGVIDFLVFALDSWYAAKAADDPQVPAHDVTLKVFSGASAGAMTAALATAYLASDQPSIVDEAAARANQGRNKLFDSWVERIDVARLLEDRDLKAQGSRVISLLDSSVLSEIAMNGLAVSPRAIKRPYLANDFDLLLTVTNLRGVPYAFKVQSDRSASFEMSLHADYVHFRLNDSGQCNENDRYPMRWSDFGLASDPNKDRMTAAALASGAFPLGLAPRMLEHLIPGLGKPDLYDSRQWQVPTPGSHDPHHCTQDEKIAADWGKLPPDYRYSFQCVDGGVMNNEPLELARRLLSGGASPNPRPAAKAERAVLLIDPFPNHEAFDPEKQPADDLLGVLLGLFDALKNQARFKHDELLLAADAQVHSRFMIAPSRANALFPIACGSLGGFGGFLKRDFRAHDYFLGRRNTQQFLRQHFTLSENNPLFDSSLPQDATDRERLVQARCIKTASGQPELDLDGKRLLPIIPLIGQADVDCREPTWPSYTRDDLTRLERQLDSRVGLVLGKLLDQYFEGSLWRLPAKLVLGRKKGDIVEYALKRVRSDLSRMQLMR